MSPINRISRVQWRRLLALSAVVLLGGAGGAGTQAPSPRPPVVRGESYEGTQVGFTAEGHPFRGRPDAPITLVEYTDYLCPFCERHVSQTVPALLEKYVRTGQLSLVVRDFPLASLHPTAAKVATATACVAEQGATLFWMMHDTVFRVQAQLSRLQDPGERLAVAAREVGADMEAFDQCMAAGGHDAKIQKAVAEAQARGFTGTPTFEFVRSSGGKTYPLSGAQPVSVFTGWIDALLAGKEPPELTQSAKPELPPWAKPRGLAPDPAHAGFTLAGDPYKGQPGAPIVVIEFADFACDSCRRHALDTQPALDTRLVETGEVMWVVKHFPLQVHPRSPVAAAAAVCAGRQGKFWEMHHALFEHRSSWSDTNDPDTSLVQLAATTGLEREPFATCLASRQALEGVLQDLYDGLSVGVRSSPTFVLVQGEVATAVVGTRSAEQFEALLRRRLDEGGPTARTTSTNSPSPLRH